MTIDNQCSLKKGLNACAKVMTYVSLRSMNRLTINSFPHNDTLLTPMGNKHFENKRFENTVGKGEIAHNEQFLLSPVFSTRLDKFLPFSSNLKLSSANSFSLEKSKFCRLVMG